MQDELVIAGRAFRSRLILGTGEVRLVRDDARRGCRVRGGDGDRRGAPDRLRRAGRGHHRVSSPTTFCSCRTRPAARPRTEAVRSARLARAGGLPDWIKLEVIPDPHYLLPDPRDPPRGRDPRRRGLHRPAVRASRPRARTQARGGRLRHRHAARGTDRQRPRPQLKDSIRIMIEQAEVPVVVDAGLGSPSHAAEGDGARRRRRARQHGHRHIPGPRRDGDRLQARG